MLFKLKRFAAFLIEHAGYEVVPLTSSRAVAREIVNAHYLGHCFRCFAGDAQCEYILRGRGWDNQLSGILRDLEERRPGAHIVEVGANIGGSLVPRAACHPGLQFHCVEPVPEFFSLLEENTASYGAPNVTLYPDAMTDTDGAVITIHTQLGTAGASPAYDGHHAIGRVQRIGVTVDTRFASYPVGLLKIDTDGFEFAVLRGAEQTLGRHRPLIFMEFHPKLMRAAGVSPQEMVDLLEQHGYCKITVWDNFGVLLLQTTSYPALLRVAEAAEYYVDVLLENTKA